MAEVDVKLILDVEVTLTLNEQEAMALDALAGYGTDAFLKCFYQHMGTSYLRPYERGLRSLFSKIRNMPVDHTLGEVRRAISEHDQRKRKAAQERHELERAAAKPREGVVVNGGAHG